MTAPVLSAFRNRFLKRCQSKRLHRRQRHPLCLEPLEGRVTPSINPATPFELDGNATTQSATTHDWDQVFADAGSPSAVPSTGSFTRGSRSLALAGTFINDQFNSTSDDIFTGGGAKDTHGIQSGPWLLTAGKPQGKDDIEHAYAAAYSLAVPGAAGGVTCKNCGLEYPHQNYRRLLAACPGCASPEWDWSHLVRDHDCAWKRLDGCAGKQEGSS
jgi:hypothetical protein